MLVDDQTALRAQDQLIQLIRLQYILDRLPQTNLDRVPVKTALRISFFDGLDSVTNKILGDCVTSYCRRNGLLDYERCLPGDLESEGITRTDVRNVLDNAVRVYKMYLANITGP
jgi:hypothetical protein